VPVDSLEPPIVLLKDGSVVRVYLENFNSIKDKIAKILFLGDILISFGDFLYTSKTLSPSGYVEEWWVKDLKKTLTERFDGNITKAAEITRISIKRMSSYLEAPFDKKPTAKEAFRISLHLNVPLYPNFTFFWSNLFSEDGSAASQVVHHVGLNR